MSQEHGFFSCFTDDLVVLDTNAYTLQQNADMVSAFALLFGLYLATHIFRVYVFGVGDPISFRQHRTLYVHGPDWTPIEVQHTEKDP
jgi:hypothetical protein